MRTIETRCGATIPLLDYCVQSFLPLRHPLRSIVAHARRAFFTVLLINPPSSFSLCFFGLNLVVLGVLCLLCLSKSFIAWLFNDYLSCWWLWFPFDRFAVIFLFLSVSRALYLWLEADCVDVLRAWCCRFLLSFPFLFSAIFPLLSP